MIPSATRVAFQHLKQARGPALFGISTKSLNMRVESWWSDLEKLVKEYWSFQNLQVRRAPGKLTFSVDGHRDGISCEIRGPVGKPTVWVGGRSQQFGPDNTLEDIIFWMDKAVHNRG